MNFKGKKVLVAGRTGLIGIPLVEILLQKGADVRIASRDDKSRAHPNAEFWNVDLLDFENCLKVCRGMDFVFNLLCVKGSPEAVSKYKVEFFENNLLLDILLLKAARIESVPGFLLASSLAVYPPAEIFYENDMWKANPSQKDWYAGWAKRMGELHAQAHQEKFFNSMKISIVRPTNTYGPNDNFNPESAMVIPSLIRRVVGSENPLIMNGRGNEIRDFIHARDMARGMVIVAEKEMQYPVNLGSGNGTTIRNLLMNIIDASGARPDIEWRPLEVSGDAVRVLNTKRAELAGFFPEISLAQGIRETVEWYKENKDKLKKQFNPF